MRNRVVFASLLLLSCTFALPSSSEDPGYYEWIAAERERRVAAAAKVAVSSRSNSNQLATPAMATNSTTLIDTSSVSDLIGLALNLAPLTGSTEKGSAAEDTTSASATLSAYALGAAYHGIDPLDSYYYCQEWARESRRYSATLGFDDSDKDDFGRVVLAGAKLQVWSDKDVCTESFASVEQALHGAVVKHAGIDDDLLAYLYDEVGARQEPPVDEVVFLDSLEDPAKFKKVREKLGGRLDQKVSDLFGDMAPFTRLDSAIEKKIRDFENQKQISVEFLTKQREKKGDEYTVQLVADGLIDGLMDLAGSESPPPPIAVTLNAAWELRTQKGPDAHGGSVALGIVYQLPEKKLSGRKPLRVSLSGEGKWLSNAEDTYQGQLSVTIPLFDGVEFPLSMTVANRTELIKETEVRGLFGFSFDTARLLKLLQ